VWTRSTSQPKLLRKYPSRTLATRRGGEWKGLRTGEIGGDNDNRVRRRNNIRRGKGETRLETGKILAKKQIGQAQKMRKGRGGEIGILNRDTNTQDGQNENQGWSVFIYQPHRKKQDSNLRPDNNKRATKLGRKKGSAGNTQPTSGEQRENPFERGSTA